MYKNDKEEDEHEDDDKWTKYRFEGNQQNNKEFIKYNLTVINK